LLKFYLWNTPGLSLLIPAKSGVVYANQTGGHHCHQQSMESILLSLFNRFDGIDQQSLLNQHFVSKLHGWCGNGITDDTADFVDEVLRATPYTSWLRVDRSRLLDSHEAWIFVQPTELSGTETIEFGDFQFSEGVITWENSD